MIYAKLSLWFYETPNAKKLWVDGDNVSLINSSHGRQFCLVYYSATFIIQPCLKQSGKRDRDG